MLVDVGTLRFAIPDGARDASTYVFRRGNVEQISVELETMPPVSTPQTLFSQRLRSVESYVGREVAASTPSASDPLIQGCDLPEVECFMGFVLGRLDAASGFAVRYACELDPPRDRAFFADVARTVRVGGSSRDVIPLGWLGLHVLGVSLGLPREFAPTVGYSYSTDEWRVRIDRKPAGVWTPYFAATDELRVLARDERAIDVGPKRVRSVETTLRVARRRAPGVDDGSAPIAEIKDEHVLREAVVPWPAGSLRLLGAARAGSEKTLEDVWNLLCGSMETRDA